MNKIALQIYHETIYISAEYAVESKIIQYTAKHVWSLKSMLKNIIFYQLQNWILSLILQFASVSHLSLTCLQLLELNILQQSVL